MEGKKQMGAGRPVLGLLQSPGKSNGDLTQRKSHEVFRVDILTPINLFC